VVDSQAPVKLGDGQHAPTLGIKEACHIQSEGTMPYEDAAHVPSLSRTVGIFLHRGRLLCVGSVTLKSASDIALGLLELHPTGVLKLPKPRELLKEGALQAIRHVALGSGAHVSIETPGNVLCHQVEIQVQDLEVRAHHFDNVSSKILIEGNAVLPDSCHLLIHRKMPNGKVLDNVCLYDSAGYGSF
jgi:hypothetical protein